MFVSFWLIFLTSGLVMAVLTVVWGIRARQFDDQQRARFLPLVGLTAREISHRPQGSFRADYIGLAAVVGAGLSAIIAGLVTTLWYM